MKLFTYINYFFFLAGNWNFSIAWYIIKQEIAGEKKYRINTTGTDDLHQLKLLGVETSHATIYMPATYQLLENLFSQPSLQHCKQLLDIGCGKGRIMCVGAHCSFENVTGIDLSKKLCQEARTNLAIVKTSFPALNYEVVNNDAFYYDIPATIDCIFLFNPFDEIIMSGVINNLEKSLTLNPRTIMVVYLNPLWGNLFIDAGYESIYHTKKMNYLEATIYTKNSPGFPGS